MSDGPRRSRLLLDVLAYVAARLVLVVVTTLVIIGVGRLFGVQDFPVVVALLFAIVIALPLGIWLFTPLRRRATESIATWDERRRRDREQLQARLRGDVAPEDPTLDSREG
ncbi:DUF4229 domain-containing protein [Mycolicibacterium hippocampi]|uniref:DUF4229 domain-containing protein n=1 Tax=Mycolicibacterium hippocampi TaxID=659824 RepID=A0A7I9ZKC0_9MYCO|nr:DUF4229 domain-containing protein [Mycolicibacterium hippocampi]GFH01276.1 hypothetical protein MHIP_17590 [Mycolicibacterium hippocampi]